MLTLTLHVSRDGAISYKTDNAYISVIGELLIHDAIQMPDFLRALATTDDETVYLDACFVQTTADFIVIKHIEQKQFPVVSLPKERFLQILTIWEEFLMQKNATQWIFFKQEEFEFSAETNKKIHVTPALQEKQKEQE
ncbi:MAG: hypothetical protein AB7R69_06485 [Candidatus Babeliales bacterium]